MEFEKKGQNHGEIMEFQNIYMEKSWKKVLALRAFHPIATHCLGYYNCYNFYHECCMWL